MKKRKAINIQWDIDEDDCECGAVPLISGVEAERKALEKTYIAALCTTRYGYNTVC